MALPYRVLSDLAARVSRLSPCHRDPERFHEEKSEIAFELRRLAREGCAICAPLTVDERSRRHGRMRASLIKRRPQ